MICKKQCTIFSKQKALANFSQGLLSYPRIINFSQGQFPFKLSQKAISLISKWSNSNFETFIKPSHLSKNLARLN
jgi:hypothetical protein